MTRASRTDSARKTRARSQPEEFHLVTASRSRSKVSGKVPMLVLRGEWLKAAGFPIDSGLHLEIDQRGEMTLHRLGLERPRRLKIVAAKR